MRGRRKEEREGNEGRRRRVSVFLSSYTVGRGAEQGGEVERREEEGGGGKRSNGARKGKREGPCVSFRMKDSSPSANLLT